MKFYDELRKPPEQPKSPEPLQFVISEIERQELADSIWRSIHDGCISAKEKGKHFFTTRYLGYVAEGEYYGTEGYSLPESFHNKKYRGIDIVPVQEDHGYRSANNNFTLESLLPAGKQVSSTISATFSQRAIWTHEERYKILLLVQKKLMSEGFPSNAVCADDYVKGIVGYGPFKRGGVTILTIKVDVRW